MKNNELKQKPKGFTLIELLVVIAILATLAVAVTLILNPAELVRQGRDSTRLSDMSALQSAVSLYLADRAEVTFQGHVSCTAGGTPSMAGGCDTTTTSTVVSGSGWLSDGDGEPNFNTISSGAPLSNLPLDPTNTTTGNHFYVWASNKNEEYEINANMESQRYQSGGEDDVESTDGGDDNDWYEVGNDPQLNVNP